MINIENGTQSQGVRQMSVFGGKKTNFQLLALLGEKYGYPLFGEKWFKFCLRFELRVRWSLANITMKNILFGCDIWKLSTPWFVFPRRIVGSSNTTTSWGWALHESGVYPIFGIPTGIADPSAMASKQQLA